MVLAGFIEKYAGGRIKGCGDSWRVGHYMTIFQVGRPSLLNHLA